jgi:Kef-type K+ transport system membrane component KefB
MHDAANDLTGLAIIALAALACGMAMQRRRHPPLMGYILAGAAEPPPTAARGQPQSFASVQKIHASNQYPSGSPG